MFQAIYSRITGTPDKRPQQEQQQQEDTMAGKKTTPKKTTPKKKATPAKRKSSTKTESRPKRARRSAADAEKAVYEPSDFTMKEAEGIKVTKGRGAKLSSFPVVKSSIEGSKRTGDEIASAHQFLFGKKGKYTKKEMKEHLLEFSGYLKPIPAGKKRTDKEVDREEEQAEVSIIIFFIVLYYLVWNCVVWFVIDSTF